jgi:hypothetical protein
VKDSVDTKKIIDATQTDRGTYAYSSKEFEEAFMKYDDARARLKKLRTETVDIEALATDSLRELAYDKVVRKDFFDFDLKNASWTGYTVNWFSAALNFGVGSNKLYNDSLTTNDSLLHFRTNNYIRAKLNLSYNLSGLSEKLGLLYYVTFSLGISNTNFLENRKIADIPYIQYDTTLKKIVVKDNEGVSLGTLGELKNTVMAWSPGFYAAAFFGARKVIGLELNNNYTFYSGKPKDLPMKKLVTSTLGIILRVNGTEALSKATIGLVAGLIDAQEDTHVWEKGFGMQLKVGVPFRALFN